MVRIKYGVILKSAAVILLLWLAISYLFSSHGELEHEEKRMDNYFKKLKNNIENNIRQDRKVIPEAVFHQGIKGNYEPDLEPRSGPGENGAGVILTDPEEVNAGRRSVSEYGFNQVASAKISMDRRIKDTRNPECKYWSYPDVKDLPTASVILVFVNEGFSTLMRTVHSVINTTPPELLAEVILVDDFSTKADLKEHLEKYIERFKGKVKIVRNSKQEGLVRARVIGAEHAVGDVIVILDAHCECVTNWLPPLLARIVADRRTVACPIVDGLDWNTLEHTDMYGHSLKRGIFEWGFLYKEMDVPQKELDKHKYPQTEAYASPTHAGGLLAIEKNWFFELGGYDPGIKIWGAEQYELSFKTWQCGGRLEWVPCSKVAHIYRGPRTESVHPIGGNPYQSKINHMRLAEVWMDEYKEHFYTREPAIGHLDFGDVSAQKELRKKLGCKPFSFFMNEVAYDMTLKFPIPPKNKVWGEAVNMKTKHCLDLMGAAYGQPIGISGCHHQAGSQLFRINIAGEMSQDEHCFHSDKDQVINRFCLDYTGLWNPVGEWEYDDTKMTIKSNKEKKCLLDAGGKLKLQDCNDSDEQKWKFNPVYY